MTDNLKQITSLLVFQEGYFYEVLILQRKKDNPNSANNQNVRIIKHYIVESLEYLLSKYDEMKTLADLFNARVYIKLSSYSKEKLGYKILETLASKFQNKDLNYSNLVTRAIGNMSPNFKFWIIDVDYKDASENDILRIKTIINDCDPNGRNVIADIPTPNGIHIITKPFNTQQFMIHQDVYYKCEIKKNNPTILYSNLIPKCFDCEKSLEECTCIDEILNI
jgi:hypothetical protein